MRAPRWFRRALCAAFGHPSWQHWSWSFYGYGFYFEFATCTRCGHTEQKL